MCWLSNLFKKKPETQPSYELPSCSDIIPAEAITVDDQNRLIIDFNKTNISFTKPPVIWTPTIADTNSMDPAMDAPSNVVAIRGADEENQKIMLDWIAREYEKGNRDILIVDFWTVENGQVKEVWIIHRLYKITSGPPRAWQLKGDNPPGRPPDPYELKDENIAYLVAVIGN